MGTATAEPALGRHRARHRLRGHDRDGAIDGDAAARLRRPVGAAVRGDDGSLLVAAHDRLVLVAPDGERLEGPTARGIRREQSAPTTAPATPPGASSSAPSRSTTARATSSCTGSRTTARLTVTDRISRCPTASRGRPDGTLLYSTDTVPGIVWARDYDPTTRGVRPAAGAPAHRGRVPRRHLRRRRGPPLGGGLRRRRGAVGSRPGPARRHRHRSRRRTRPASPSPATELDRLLITTASRELTADERPRRPRAGRLFTADRASPGLPRTPWSAAAARPHGASRDRCAHSSSPGPASARCRSVDAPVAAPGGVVVDVERVGVCGTDVEFFTGDMAYLRRGTRPTRCGSGTSGAARSPRWATASTPRWLGRRVTGDTMLGCGVCRRCVRGDQHVCEDRQRGRHPRRFPGALAEQLAVPASSLHALPDTVDATLGALVEPGGNALRAARGAGLADGRPGARARAGHHRPARRACSLRAPAPRCTCMGRSAALARRTRATLGFDGVWTRGRPARTCRSTRSIDSSNAPAPARRRRSTCVEPGRPSRLHRAGRTARASSTPARWCSRTSPPSASSAPRRASPGPSSSTRRGAVDPRPLVAATVGPRRGRRRPGRAPAGGGRAGPEDPRRPENLKPVRSTR